ncbi:MAG: T9SS type A sorting domain-containing protein [Saprospiraceae bacterium]|nr:T9SS type A sorting domain-containing protein [Saprospiraceae bacterium]
MKTTLTLFAFCFPGWVLAQEPPILELQLTFEDARGNRDTLEVGFDTAANLTYNPTFGELDIATAFQGPLDVRAAHRSLLDMPSHEGILSKRIISHAEENVPPKWFDKPCYSGAPILLFMRADHFPVTMRWNPDAFWEGRECTTQSFVTPDSRVEIADPMSAWIGIKDKRFSCMIKADYFTVNLDPDYSASHFSDVPYHLVRNFGQSSNDTIYGMALFFTDQKALSPCSVYVNDFQANGEAQALKVFPNPAYDRLHVDREVFAGADEVSICDLTGRTVIRLSAADVTGTIDISSLEKGWYYLAAYRGNQRIQGAAFVK